MFSSAIEAPKSRHHDALALHHDLWIELERVEIALEKLQSRGTDADGNLRQQLEQRRSSLGDALQRLAA